VNVKVISCFLSAAILSNLKVISSGFKGHGIFLLTTYHFITYKNFPLSDTSFLYEERMAGVAIHPPSSLSADNKKTRNNFYVH
jgi:hypothetical protein